MEKRYTLREYIITCECMDRILGKKTFTFYTFNRNLCISWLCVWCKLTDMCRKKDGKT